MSSDPTGLPAPGSPAGCRPVTDLKSSASHPGEAAELVTWLILLSHSSNDPENMWVNCQREGGDPVKSLGSRSGLRSRSNLVWKFRAAYLHGCAHLYCTRQQKNRGRSHDSAVSWERNSLSCTFLFESQAAVEHEPLWLTAALLLVLINVFESSSTIWFIELWIGKNLIDCE